MESAWWYMRGCEFQEKGAVCVGAQEPKGFQGVGDWPPQRFVEF